MIGQEQANTPTLDPEASAPEMIEGKKKYPLYQNYGREHNMHQDREMGGEKNTQTEDTRKDWNPTMQTTPALHWESTAGGAQAKRIWYRQ